MHSLCIWERQTSSVGVSVWMLCQGLSHLRPNMTGICAEEKFSWPRRSRLQIRSYCCLCQWQNPLLSGITLMSRDWVHCSSVAVVLESVRDQLVLYYGLPWVKTVWCLFEQHHKLRCNQSSDSVIFSLSYCQILLKEWTIPWWFVFLLHFFLTTEK